jgi:hypothetical protein
VGAAAWCFAGWVPSLLSSSSNPPSSLTRLHGGAQLLFLPPSLPPCLLRASPTDAPAASGVRFSSEDATACRPLAGHGGPTAHGLPVVDPAARQPFQQWRC